jgi:glucose/arabinose dehydrogenase
MDANGDGVADSSAVNVVKSDLPLVHGITFHEGNVYLATETRIYVGVWQGGDSVGPLSEFIGDLPPGGQHPNKTLAFGPDGQFYVTAGSTCNACDEPTDEYRNNALVAMRGSWNRNPPSGYKVVRISFDDARAGAGG